MTSLSAFCSSRFPRYLNGMKFNSSTWLIVLSTNGLLVVFRLRLFVSITKRLLSVLQGKMLSEFDNNAMVIAEPVTLSRSPMMLRRSQRLRMTVVFKRDSLYRRLKVHRVDLLVVLVIRSNSRLRLFVARLALQWNVYFVTGITSDDQAVFFSDLK